MSIDFPIDLVVTYVDDTDPVWRNAAKQYNAELSSKRFRSWNIFKYWFRGVELCMPFIRTIHLVVSNIELVPTWLDQDSVNVVLHELIIPKKLLPTFNSTTIEMYLHRIPSLAEHFIYSNDDMFPIRLLLISDFFKDCNYPQYKLIWRNNARSIFRLLCKNSYQLAGKLAKIQLKDTYFCIAHSMTPSLKSVYEDVHSKAGNEILKRCTKFREPWNFTQYLFPDYALMIRKAVEVKDISFRYFLTDKINQIENELLTGNSKIICINDHVITDFKIKEKKLSNIFQSLFPKKSKFELYNVS